MMSCCRRSTSRLLAGLMPWVLLTLTYGGAHDHPDLDRDIRAHATTAVCAPTGLPSLGRDVADDEPEEPHGFCTACRWRLTDQAQVPSAPPGPGSAALSPLPPAVPASPARPSPKTTHARAPPWT